MWEWKVLFESAAVDGEPNGTDPNNGCEGDCTNAN